MTKNTEIDTKGVKGPTNLVYPTKFQTKSFLIQGVGPTDIFSH